MKTETKANRLHNQPKRKSATEWLSFIGDFSKRVISLYRNPNAHFENMEVSLFESNNGVIRLSIGTNIICWSKAAERIFGYDGTQAIGKTIVSILPEIFENGGYLISRILQGDSIEHYEIVRKGEDQLQVDLSISVYPIRNSLDELTGSWIVARDITEKKQALAKTISNQRRINALIENLTDGISMPDANGVISYQNQALMEILGYTLEERQSIPIRNIIHPDHLGLYFQLLERLTITPGVPGPFQFLFKHKHGHYIWLEGVLTNMLHNPDVQSYVVNCRDITERKEIEARLIASEIRFKALIEHSSDGITLTDANLKTIYRSPSGSRIGGFGVDEIRTDIHSETHPDDTSIVRDRYQKALENPGVSIPFEGRYKKKDGSYFWASGVMLNLLDLPGVNAIVVNYRDVSDRKKIEAEISQLTNELKEKVIQRTSELELINKELEAFSYSVSHDLRAPLRIINGFSEILLEDHLEVLDEKGQKALNVIIRNAKKMGQLIDDLLEFSRVGRTALQCSMIDMNELAEEALEELRHSGFVIPDNVILHPMKVAYGDINLIKVIWTNLLSNAVKYSSKHAIPTIEVGMIIEGDDQLYYVKDNGAGFDMQYVDKLFNVFQRLHKQDEFAGTGVGLALAQRVVSRHGGIIKAQGEVDNGATFLFTLPLPSPQVVD